MVNGDVREVEGVPIILQALSTYEIHLERRPRRGTAVAGGGAVRTIGTLPRFLRTDFWY